MIVAIFEFEILNNGRDILLYFTLQEALTL